MRTDRGQPRAPVTLGDIAAKRNRTERWLFWSDVVADDIQSGGNPVAMAADAPQLSFDTSHLT